MKKVVIILISTCLLLVAGVNGSSSKQVKEIDVESEVLVCVDFMEETDMLS